MSQKKCQAKMMLKLGCGGWYCSETSSQCSDRCMFLSKRTKHDQCTKRDQ